MVVFFKCLGSRICFTSRASPSEFQGTGIQNPYFSFISLCKNGICSDNIFVMEFEIYDILSAATMKTASSEMWHRIVDCYQHS